MGAEAGFVRGRFLVPRRCSALVDVYRMGNRRSDVCSSLFEALFTFFPCEMIQKLE